MKELFWTYGMILLGLFVIVVMLIVQNMTTTSEENYYLMKEVFEAAMIDSVDYGVYRETGELRIIEEKFVENFIRRFSESVSSSKTYKIEFFEIYEEPPKATVRISTKTGNYVVGSDTIADFDIATILSEIIESKLPESECPNGWCDSADGWTN